jgi:ribonuclease R
MEKHIGSEFEGVVTGVTSFGLFVELDESKVSGLVHISQLANDYYHFDAVRKLLKGERSGAQFRLGDHVRVQVLRASLEDRKIDFRLVTPRSSNAASPASGKAFDYAASGERYSLPKRAPPPAKPAGMLGRAANAIGKAFGRRDEAPAKEMVASPYSKSRAKAAGHVPEDDRHAHRQSQGKHAAKQGKRQGGSNKPAPAGGNKKGGKRKPTSKGRS